ncbi:T9SS type A sorting domain-containing protein [Candidatus Poribacteria bacterium]|nr:T9SS type A sorting domain-containing protein [Candidatus Poribacteria bacterium]
MNTYILNQKGFVFILVSILMITFGSQSISYAQEENPTITASTPQPLTEGTLHKSIVTLTLNAAKYERSVFDIKDAVAVSGIDGVTVRSFFGIDRVNDTEITVELEFVGNIDINATLTFSVGAVAIAGYNGNALTAQLPVTAVEESLVISTEFPLTEANLDGSIITLTLTGRRLADSLEDIRDALSVSGIDGLAINRYGSFPSNDTELGITLTFSGNMDTDATLTLTVGADAIAGYNQGATKQFPVTAIQKSNATLSISPASVPSPAVGEQLTFNLNIKGGENVAGYQATVLYDPTALYPVDITNGDYLPENPFFLLSNYYGKARITASTLAEATNGDGTLAILTFEVEDFKASTLTLSEVYLVDADGKQWEATTVGAEVTIPPKPAEAIFGDINRDGVVNIQDLIIVNARFGQTGQNSADLNEDGLVDIVDLVLVAGAFGAEAAAPTLNPQALARLTTHDVHGWLSQARQLTRTNPAYLRGITALEQLLKTLTPKKNALLPNYPNPFNPETWIPYHLSNDADVQVSIYDAKGVLVRRLDLGHQMAGYYTTRAKAAHWDGKNEFGEKVASSVYFYRLSAGDYSATRKMLILK